MRSKIRSLHKAKKSHKRLWSNIVLTRLVNLSLPLKCFDSTKADQANLDQHKDSCLNNKLYDVPLDESEGLPPQPLVIKKFTISFFSYDDFLNLLSSCRNTSAPGLNGIPYKAYKKCSKLSKPFFLILKCTF